MTVDRNGGQRQRFKYRQLIFFLCVLAVLCWILWQAGTALLPFVLGLTVAYLIAPQVTRLQRLLPARSRSKPYANAIAILVVYLAFIASVLIAGALILPPLIQQTRELVQTAPSGFDALTGQVQSLLKRYERLPAPVKTEIEAMLDADALHALSGRGLALLQQATFSALVALSGTLSWLLGMLVVPIWLFYILDDTDYVLKGSLGLVPREIRPDLEAVRIIVDRVLSAYIRGQLIIALILGILLSISLYFLGVDYALLLGFVAGSLGFIPYVGAILGAIPAILVAAFQSFGLAVKVIIALIVIQQIDGTFISPRVQGKSVALRPALILVVLVIGQQVWGFMGLLLAVPVTGILRDIVHYVYLRLGEPSPSPQHALATVGYGKHVTTVITSGGDLSQA